MKTRAEYLIILEYSSSDNPSKKDLKERFRKLKFEKHPDRNLNNPNATEEFKIIAEAYDALLNNKFAPPAKKEITTEDITKKASEGILSFLDKVSDKVVISNDKITFKLIGNTLIAIKCEINQDRYLLINNYPIKLEMEKK